MATPLLNTRDTLGIHIRTNNADVTPVAQIDMLANQAVMLDLFAVGYTVSGAALPAAYSYWRRALYVTDSAGAITQVGSTQTPAADLESVAGADLIITISGSSIILSVSASFPTQWTVTGQVKKTTRIQQG